MHTIAGLRYCGAAVLTLSPCTGGIASSGAHRRSGIPAQHCHGFDAGVFAQDALDGEATQAVHVAGWLRASRPRLRPGPSGAGPVLSTLRSSTAAPGSKTPLLAAVPCRHSARRPSRCHNGLVLVWILAGELTWSGGLRSLRWVLSFPAIAAQGGTPGFGVSQAFYSHAWSTCLLIYLPLCLASTHCFASVGQASARIVDALRADDCSIKLNLLN